MRRLTFEITQDPASPEKIKVCLGNQDGPIQSAEYEGTLPWDGSSALPIILKVLDKPVYSAGAFNDQETQWLVDNGLANLYKEKYFLDSNIQEKIGEKLYQALIGNGGPLAASFQAAMTAAKQTDEPIHLEIKFPQDATLVGAYPWELLFDGQDFLCLGGACLLTRLIEEDQSSPPVRGVPDKLRILFISPRPSVPDVEKLDQQEAVKTSEAFKQYAWNQSVEVETLEKPTYAELINYLQANRGRNMPHIIHFDGHGVFGRQCPGCKKVETSPDVDACACGYPLGDPRRDSQGFLVFEDERGNVSFIKGKDLGEQIRVLTVLGKDGDVSFEGLCLVVLSACESAMAGRGRSVFSGVAQSLIHSRVPAVVAMQFSVTENDALDFVSTFYQNVAQGQPMVKAVLGGRSRLRTRNPDRWYRPVLYLRWREHEGGRLFNIGPMLLYPDGPNGFVKQTRWAEQDQGKGKMAVDQTVVVKDFVRMLVPKWREDIPWRALLLEGKKNTGKTIVLNRFELCCKKVQENTPLVYALIRLEQKVARSPAELAAEMVQKLITSAEGFPEIQQKTDRLKLLLDRVTEAGKSRNAAQDNQDMQVMGKTFYQSLNAACQGLIAVLMLDNFDALFNVPSGQGLKAFLQEMTEGIKSKDTPNCIFAAITSSESLKRVPNNLADLEKTIDLTSLENVKYHEAICQIGVEDVQELASEEFHIKDLSKDAAGQLIDLSKNNASVTDVQVLRNLLGNPLILRAYGIQ